jgi:WD40 repeat protein
MELFKFEKNSDNNNNNNKLKKIQEININNSISDKNNSDNEIKCMHLFDSSLLCGHNGGYISLWNSDQQSYLKFTNKIQLHGKSINQIFYVNLNGNKFFISASSDNFIKLYNIQQDKVEHQINLNKEIIEVKLVKDFNQQNIIIASLREGELIALNEKLEKLFDIPSRFKTNILRKVTSIKNSNNNEGDYLLITEGSKIDIFCLINPQNIQIFKAHNFHPNQTPHRGGHNYQFRGGLHY